MYVFDQTGAVNSAKLIEYITKEFPGEFKQLIEARDELAKRQGALSAVDAANKDRAKAAAELEAAKSQASAILADAQAEALAAQAKAQAAAAQEAALQDAQKAFAAEMATKTEAVMLREQQAAAREASAAAMEADCAKRLESLAADRATLNARIKAFHDKVAALSV